MRAVVAGPALYVESMSIILNGIKPVFFGLFETLHLVVSKSYNIYVGLSRKKQNLIFWVKYTTY